MDSIALQIRALQFLAHRAHNEVHGPTFFQDHEFLSGLYSAYEGFYDDVVERILGLGTEKLDIAKLNENAAKMASVNVGSKDAMVFLRTILKGEEDLCKLIKKAVPNSTDGTQNLIQGIADISEKTQYKLKKRLGVI